MERIIKNYSPDSLFGNFEEISAIPRGSGNEAQIAAYIEKKARALGHFCVRDGANNVFVRIAATKGREKEKAVLLQGHTDMVCEKNADTEHDFLRDGLKLYVENGILRARGTTLGADNGIAVAVMLALMEGECDSHPTLECLFTTDEEVGLLGAGSFDYSVVTATKMINMDSEEEGAVVVGCAGGVRSDMSIKCKTQTFRGEALNISLTGLFGGHSGENIGSGRANAIKLMGRILLALSAKMRVNVLSVSGGSKDNAIPREASATVSVANAERAAKAVLAEGERIRVELVSEDEGLVVSCSIADAPEHMLDAQTSRRILGVLGCVQNGVIEMSNSVAGLVGFSRNLGIVRTDSENGEVVFTFSSRSSLDSQLDASIASLDALAALCGGKTRHHSRYPGWSYAKRSPMREKYIAAAREIFGKEPTVRVLHAGLECGIIKSRLPRLDIISVGPDMKDIHSPDEQLDLRSCERFWTLICRLLAK